MAWDRVERLIGTDNLQRLARAHVGVVGLGSGGGFAAVSLAMSGVQHFVLIDHDALETVNVVRHVADRRYVGQNKAQAVADLIRQRSPNAQVEVREGRIEQHLDALDGLDLLIVGVDGENVKYIINEACLQRSLTAVYAGVYEKGEGGDVVIIRPYNGPCYACWAATLREGVAAASDIQVLDYGMIGPEGTLEAEPALWLHVVRVAGAQSDLALKVLLGQDASLPGNTLVLANNALEILEGVLTPQYGALWLTVERDPDCLVCGDAAKQRAALEAESAVSLEELASQGGSSIVIQDGE